MLIAGYATQSGTERFKQRFQDRLPGHFRQAQNLWLSSIGLGTYLGEADERYDKLYTAAVSRAVESGVNVIDSAVNYRHQRSERAIGRSVRELVMKSGFDRSELFLSTKGGFLTFDSDAPEDPSSYFYEQVIGAGLARPEDIAADCHVISPAYLKRQIEVSRKNLGVETIDLYYVHNPETQLQRVKSGAFYQRLKDAFVALEEAVAEGKIRAYGAATWNAFRVGGDSGEAVSLTEVARAAEEAGGKGHHFRAIQLPFNMAMPEALVKPTQLVDGKTMPLLRAASRYDLAVFASASLLQGQLTEGLPPEIARHFPKLKTDAQRAIQFVRSTPGIACALVGMSQIGHVEENLAAAAVPPLSPEAYQAIFSS